MTQYTWNEDSALYQVKNGEPGSERTESAFRYLESYIGWQPDHIARGTAHDLLDALREMRARELPAAGITYKSPGGTPLSRDETVSYLAGTRGLAAVNLSTPGYARPIVQVETRPHTGRIALSQIGSVAGVTAVVARINATLWTAAASLAKTVSDRPEQDQETRS